MQLTLNDQDAQTLEHVLNAYLPDLRREAAATELGSRELRHELAVREDLCERLLAELERRAAPA